MVSDETLILEYQRGSREAFQELFARYRQPIYAFFRRRLTGKDRAEDLTQETFVVIVRNSVRYQPKALFRTYLYGIAMNILSAERRRAERAQRELNPEITALDDLSEPGLWVREALEKLAPEERQILMLREYEQLSYSEIAALLNLPINTVRSKLFRARQALKNHLEPAPRVGARQE
jgi:RNA polymerase sigma-70 factor, ECF subfamily